MTDTDNSEWYYYHTDSIPESEDEIYYCEEGRTTVFLPYDGITTTYSNIYLDTIGEILEQLYQLNKFDLSLIIKPDPTDLNTFWSFHHWNACDINEVYSINAYWYNNLSVIVEYNLFMNKDNFETLAPFFTIGTIPGCSNSYDELLTNVRAVQLQHNRNMKIEGLFGSF
ncbi:hypothetical protein ACFPAF_01775 [Hymenobacter endophyticus]|uniref:Uncharacterized protein n=1 Tax=Hymenobacter endophyticus TaxID=3076335 RepID=A0ABU3TCL6_9BACT|nr:hypothetical protein [Hymenobacter endophyticus]MDU0369107.1 hypothetical protein [Hymenobacter endophyticus]